MAKKTLKLTLSNKENRKNDEKASFLACFFCAILLLTKGEESGIIGGPYASALGPNLQKSTPYGIFSVESEIDLAHLKFPKFRSYGPRFY